MMDIEKVQNQNFIFFEPNDPDRFDDIIFVATLLEIRRTYLLLSLTILAKAACRQNRYFCYLAIVFLAMNKSGFYFDISVSISLVPNLECFWKVYLKILSLFQSRNVGERFAQCQYKCWHLIDLIDDLFSLGWLADRLAHSNYADILISILSPINISPNRKTSVKGGGVHSFIYTRNKQ